MNEANDVPALPCCDYRDHGSGVCACPEHDYSPLHPFGATCDFPHCHATKDIAPDREGSLCTYCPEHRATVTANRAKAMVRKP